MKMSSTENATQSVGCKWPPPTSLHVAGDTWGSGSDRPGHLGQLTINTGWTGSSLAASAHTQVSRKPHAYSCSGVVCLRWDGVQPRLQPKPTHSDSAPRGHVSPVCVMCAVTSLLLICQPCSCSIWAKLVLLT